MTVNVVDYIPHGMIAAFAAVISFIYKEHTDLDDVRFSKIATELANIQARQTDISDKMAENHAEILRTLLSAEQLRATVRADKQ